MKRFQLSAALFFAVTFPVWLARAEMHTDDAGILVGLIAIGGFLLSLIEPRFPWIWGLIVPSGIIVSNAWRHTGSIGSLFGIAGVTIAVGCAGAYAGALLQRHVPPSSVR
jgi:hypothetical protein